MVAWQQPTTYGSQIFKSIKRRFDHFNMFFMIPMHCRALHKSSAWVLTLPDFAGNLWFSAQHRRQPLVPAFSAFARDGVNQRI
jgi:hypothetical protein